MDEYGRIEKAMAYMVDNAASQPSLAEVAAHVYWSPAHFQRVFRRYAGISPKRFLQALTLERAKRLMASTDSLLQAAHAVGLSGGSRLYDHFVSLDAVTPGEHKRQGDGLTIRYGVHSTPFGAALAATTERGICRLGFIGANGMGEQLAGLTAAWPKSQLIHQPEATRYVVEALFDGAFGDARALSLHVAGTNFQVAVWRALLAIPAGELASYGQLAKALGKPGASRAVGSAVGANPVALWIPCHRVIQQSGALGGYRWGVARKQMVQAWESSQQSAKEGSPGSGRLSLT
ncbi:bifunctional transcriptional activator/DNA repair enzyme AdaA [Halomonas sp. GD1P12]|uniref:bifunctional transcriptional activator/DNA repair enzyme AdaA n=1 Tax=Halomonas sp. GD1P12 TaxID=2982691 RepID=UPI0021E44867|nr:methylated-DNA--[protein]-cysteine S-methyltransferase [Halomonas sp. GD1P12]UYG01291.1 methylated-DNA--[protein]-cysteine S-methyltransferase [Halomonas sp. GD1P12]